MLIVFGSNNMDLVMRVGRLPAPGETVIGGDYGLKPGGKGANQAVAGKRDAADVVLVAAVGDDLFGADLREKLGKEGLNEHLIASDKPTGCATVMVGDDAENQIVVSPGANAALKASDVPVRLYTTDNTVLMQMEVPLPENMQVALAAKAQNTTTILNAAPMPAEGLPRDLLKNLDYLVVNQVEAGQLAASLGLPKMDNPVTLAKRLSAETGASLIMTLGKDGALGIEKNRAEVFHVKPMAVDIIDTTGAGDTFTGVFAGSIDRGASMQQAMHRASIAAALACTGLGAQSAMPDAGVTNTYTASHPMPVPAEERAFAPRPARTP